MYKPDNGPCGSQNIVLTRDQVSTRWVPEEVLCMELATPAKTQVSVDMPNLPARPGQRDSCDEALLCYRSDIELPSIFLGKSKRHGCRRNTAEGAP